MRKITGPLRFGIVGTGKVAKKHALALRALGPAVTCAGVTDLKPEKAQAFAAEHGFAKVYPNAQAMLADGAPGRPAIDALTICTPPRSHADLISQALHAGRAVLCEKPVVPSLHQLDQLITLERSLADRGGAVGCIFQWRYGRGLQMLQNLIQHQRTGRLLYVALQIHWYRTMDYYANPFRGTFQHETGGVTVTQGIHGIDAVLAITGAAARVTARMATLNHPIEVEDYCHAQVEFANGALGTMQFTVDSALQRSSMIFGFENLTALSNDSYANSADLPWQFVATTRGGPELQSDLDHQANHWAGQPGGSNHTAQYAAFVQEIKSAQHPRVGLPECRPSAELISALYHSAQAHTPIDLPLRASDPYYQSWHGPTPKPNAP